MSTRQKSFFEQNANAKPKYPQWRRKHDNNGSRGQYPSNNEPPARQPIAPSVQTRTKLKAFQFIEGRPSEKPTVPAEPTDKENETPVRMDSLPEGGNVEMAKTPSKNAPAAAEATADTAIPPSTPATRLPLADLVGISDATNRQPPPNVSPEDHVTWEHVLSPQVSNHMITPAARRGKKRARSSSPETSSQSHFDSAERTSLEGQTMHRVLKTPQADPVADLWNRYTTSTQSRDQSTAKKSLCFAHLINEASPHSSAIAGNISGLRRWTSCGLEFPTSNAKRRRTTGRFRAGGLQSEALFDDQDEADGEKQDGGKPAGSKAERLLEQIQRTLNKPATPNITDLPSSSSPLPEARGFQVASQASPLQNLARPPNQRSSGVSIKDLPSRPASQNDRCQKSPSSSSDYGGEDLDMDMVEAIEATQGNMISNDAGPQQSYSFEPIPRNTASQHAPAMEPSLVAPPAKTSDSDDEFGLDDDDDVFAADLEDLASRYDSGPDAICVATAGAEKDKTGEEQQEKADGPEISADYGSDDEFGTLDDIDEEQFVAAVEHATQACKSGGTQSSMLGKSKTIDPCRIVEVRDGQYQNDRGFCLPEKILMVRNARQKCNFLVFLRQSWYDSPCAPGSYINIIGDCDSEKNYTIDDQSGLLILHPDQLLSATSVSESAECLRRSVLGDRVKMVTSKNSALVYGYLLHELFQEAMKTNQWDEKWLDKCAREILLRHLEDLLEIGVSVEQARDHLLSKAPTLQGWAEVFVRANPGPNAVADGRNGQKMKLSISKLLDVEENILSPAYGLKGKIDATVQVTMTDDGGERVLTVPFELKTGKDNASHRAQTALYTLLLSDRYDVEVANGILWNIESSKMSSIEASRHLIRPLIMRRNELASWVRERSLLPPMVENYMFCDNCKVRDPCFLYNRLVDGGDGTILRPKAKETFDQLVRYLKPNHAEFFVKWQTLLSQEEADMMKFRKELWTMLSTERERVGRAFSNVVIEPGSFQELQEGSKINRFRYTFIKQKFSPSFSFAESQLVVGEPVVVSDQEGHYCLARGFVTGVRKKRITVAVDRALHNARRKKPGFDAARNQVFAGITELPGSDIVDAEFDGEPVVYRLDKDEFENAMGIPRNNLIQLMNDGVFRAAELRSLIVDGRAPSFQPVPSAPLVYSQSGMAMNSDQIAAVEKVMSARDYALVLGMPGTGKTTTIAHIIRALVGRGKSVLLTSFQHSAVDNILLKIQEDNIPVLRLGAVAKVHLEVQKFAILAEQPKNSLSELEHSWMDAPIVAATCLKVDHPVFSRRIFDYCIVDEASQITLPTCLGPIRMARTFVLVGDHHQLPPLVQNRDALAGGLDNSLFRLLSERHPEAVVNLEHQYRMAADIMLLSNTLIYSGRLKCGTEAVANRVLEVPNPNAVESCHCTVGSGEQGGICDASNPSTCYIARVLQPTTRVLFLNTDLLADEALEISAPGNGNRITNPLEATVLTHVTAALLNAGVSASDIGIVTPFRSQLSLLRTSLRSSTAATATSASSAIELNTADKYQGRDKPCILVSFVRANASRTVGELLRDERRINVALTRAQSKLVLVGSKRTLGQGSELLRRLVEICDEKGWTWDLQPGVVESHRFDGFGTQGTATQGTPESGGGRRQQGNSPMKRRRVLLSSPLGDTEGERMPLSPLGAKGLNARAAMRNPNPPFRQPLRQPLKQLKGSQGNERQDGLRKPGKVVQGKQASLMQLFEKRGSVVRDVFNDAI